MRTIEELKNKIIQGNALLKLKELPDESVDTIITSPPYWGLRDYGVEEQIGLEKTLDEYINKMLQITAELKRVLKKTGVIFWNHGDCYGSNISAPNQPKLGKRDPYKELGKENRLRDKRYQKCLMLQNYRLILKIIDEQGWILRNVIIWHKPNHMPSSVKDRFANAYEPVFMLVKNKKYWFDLDAVRVPHKEVSIERAKRGVSPNHKYANLPHYGGGGGINKPRANRKTKIPKEFAESFGSPRARYHRKKYEEGIGAVQHTEDRDGMVAPLHPLGKNPGNIWQIPTQPFPEAHFATFPEKLVEPMIKAGCPERGIVLDPFMGAGTTAVVAKKLKRDFIGIELNPEYIKIAEKRIKATDKPML